MMDLLTDLLYNFVRKLIPCGPRCLSISVEMPSGPNAFEFFAFFIASIVCWVVMVTLASEGVFFSCLINFLDSLDVLVDAFGVYWVLNLVASFLGSLVALPLKKIA